MDWAGYDFSVDWFTRHMPVWDRLLLETSPSRIVEIGSYEGRSACYLIDRVARQRPLSIWCVDSWLGGVENDPGGMAEVERRFDANVTIAIGRAKFPVQVKKLKSLSNLALAAILAVESGQTMDLIYVDGSHQAPDVLSDAVMGFSLLKVGGLMIFDDYIWRPEPAGQRDPLNMPKMAIDAFLNIYMRKMNVIAHTPLLQLYAEKVAA